MIAPPKKQRFPRAVGLAVAREVCRALKSHCLPDRLLVAGSLRRGRATVGDVEILYIGRREVRPVAGDLFASEEVNLATRAILDLESAGALERRETVAGHHIFGVHNKFLRHVETGLPVDFFTVPESSWWNNVVCRTGPAELNTRIATLAKSRGWQWHPYGSGFSHLRTGREVHVTCERDVFAHVDLPYLEPCDR